MFSKHRIEALSDGVFAIAMTLLILDIKVPMEVGPGGLGHALRHESHEWVSFAVTFVIASIFWMFQHRVFEVLDSFGKMSMALTFVCLGFVTVLPFSTSLWGHHITEPLAFMFYFGNQFLIGLLLTAKLELASRRGHVRAGKETEMLRLRLWMLCAIMGSAAVATRLFPLQYLFVVPLVLGVTARWLRSRQKQKWERLEAGASS